MPNRALDEGYEEAFEDYGDIEEDDYGFVFDSEGNIKFMFLPDNMPFRPPKNIAKIMKVLDRKSTRLNSSH